MRPHVPTARLLLALAVLASPARTEEFRFSLVHYGRLLDSADQPVSATGQPFTFRLVNRSVVETSEQEVWSATCNLDVKNGNYSVALGAGCGAAHALGLPAL